MAEPTPPATCRVFTHRVTTVPGQPGTSAGSPASRKPWVPGKRDSRACRPRTRRPERPPTTREHFCAQKAAASSLSAGQHLRSGPRAQNAPHHSSPSQVERGSAAPCANHGGLPEARRMPRGSLLGPAGCWLRNRGKTCLRVPGLLERLAVLEVGGLGTPCWNQFPSLVLDRTSRVPSWAEGPGEGRGAAGAGNEELNSSQRRAVWESFLLCLTEDSLPLTASRLEPRPRRPPALYMGKVGALSTCPQQDRDPKSGGG